MNLYVLIGIWPSYILFRNKIELLNKEVEHLRNKQSSTNTEMTSKGFGGLNETLDLINAKNNVGNDGQAYKGNL